MRRIGGLVCTMAVAAQWLACTTSDATPSAVLRPSVVTTAVATDADDPAIWIHPVDRSRSLVLGTNKIAAPDGALYVFALDGSVRQTVRPLDRPNNVDVEYGLATPAGAIDIAVVTERLQQRLRVFRIRDDGLVPIDGGGIRVLEGQTGEAAMPMGVAIYRRPRDGQIFAIVAPKTGGPVNYLWQYQLTFDGSSGLVRGALVRRFGTFSGAGEIEAVAVDDALGYVYYADEEFAIRKWAADPDHAEGDHELGRFGIGTFAQQREGIAILANDDGTGFIVCTDQIPGGSVLRVYRREGLPGRPHVHDPPVAAIRTTADSTDGIDATSSSLGDRFPAGLLVMMNSAGKNFQLYDLRRVLQPVVAP